MRRRRRRLRRRRRRLRRRTKKIPEEDDDVIEGAVIVHEDVPDEAATPQITPRAPEPTEAPTLGPSEAEAAQHWRGPEAAAPEAKASGIADPPPPLLIPPARTISRGRMGRPGPSRCPPPRCVTSSRRRRSARGGEARRRRRSGGANRERARRRLAVRSRSLPIDVRPRPLRSDPAGRPLGARSKLEEMTRKPEGQRGGGGARGGEGGVHPRRRSRTNSARRGWRSIRTSPSRGRPSPCVLPTRLRIASTPPCVAPHIPGGAGDGAAHRVRRAGDGHRAGRRAVLSSVIAELRASRKEKLRFRRGATRSTSLERAARARPHRRHHVGRAWRAGGGSPLNRADSALWSAIDPSAAPSAEGQWGRPPQTARHHLRRAQTIPRTAEKAAGETTKRDDDSVEGRHI